MASVKRKRVSKKNKISWRKNVDITDVENFLEDQRLEERLGTKFSEKSNDELFTIDTGDLTTPVETIVRPKVPTIRKSLRVKEDEVPKCFSLLERRSAVPDPVLKRNPVKIREKLKKLPSNYVPGRFIRKQPVKPKVNIRDIWAEKDTTRQLNGLAEWMRPDTVRHTLHNTGHKSRKRPEMLGVKPSPIAAVEVPHPGTSYNPSLSDHRALLHQVVAQEMKEEKEEEHIRRVTTKMFRKIPLEEAHQNWLKEMSGGIDPSSGSDSDEEVTEYKTVNPPALRKKKTLQKRRKIREERERQRAAAERKLEKKKRADVNDRLPGIRKSIEKKEKESVEFQKRKKERIDQKVTETKVLGKTKFAAPRLEFQSPKDLTGNLRKLAPEGSILQDRFLSLQKRNVLEPTQLRHIRKAKVKRFVKGSHKMGWEPKGF